MSNYGIEASKRRAKKKAEREEQKLNEKPKSLKKKKIKAPNIDWNPLDNKNIDKVKFNSINWNDKSTTTHSQYLKEKLIDENLHMQLLKMPPGSGKTAIAVETLGRIQEELDEKIPFVVISTRKSVEGLGWHRTIKWWNECYPNNQLKPEMITTVDKFKALCQHNQSKVKLMKSFNKNAILVLDEAHSYKNPTGQRAKQLQKLSMFKRLTLTATPLTNNQIDDIMSYLIMAGEYKNKSDFKRVSGLGDLIGFRGAYMIYDEDGRVNEFLWPYYNTMMEQWGKYLYRPNVNFRDLNMPEIDRQVIQLKRSPELQSDMRSLASAKRKRMFDSSMDYYMEAIERLHNDKQRLDTLIEIIQKDNVIQPLIFYQNIPVKEAIEERLKKEKINYQLVNGDTSLDDIDFDSDNTILIQYKSGSESIEFKHSNTSIFYQNQWSYFTFDQARGRNRRRGMEHKITHYNIIADDPLDERIYDSTELREELNEEMIQEAIDKAAEIYES